MDTLIIRVYKICFPGGRIAFEFVREDEGKTTATGTIRMMARRVRHVVAEFLGDPDDPLEAVDPWGRVFVGFTPQYDIVCRLGHVPGRCTPLTDEEKNAFWDAFIRSS